MLDNDIRDMLTNTWIPLYGRIPHLRQEWLHLGAVQHTAEGLRVRWNEDTRALQPAWSLALQGESVRGETIQFSVLLQGRWRILAEVSLSRRVIDAVQQEAPQRDRWNGRRVRDHRGLRSNWPGEARLAAAGWGR